ncbi:luciferase family protein [Jatrophihabitans sp.]|uniref:luciferase family protein n=1 Tax=Jatrophihabitans sp. TaxID=1932789 RepID=UPI0030C782F0|nr:hypothetical protein [Jatrophihabitans sp.]
MDVDVVWQAVLDECRRLAPVEVGRSRFAPKPAIFLHGREIAHWDGPGGVDLRITAAGWREVREVFGADPAVRHDPGRRDWVELRAAATDVDRLLPLIAAAVAAND